MKPKDFSKLHEAVLSFARTTQADSERIHILVLAIFLLTYVTLSRGRLFSPLSVCFVPCFLAFAFFCVFRHSVYVRARSFLPISAGLGSSASLKLLHWQLAS